MSEEVGFLLVEKGIMTQKQLEEALSATWDSGASLIDIVLQRGYATAEQIAVAQTEVAANAVWLDDVEEERDAAEQKSFDRQESVLEISPDEEPVSAPALTSLSREELRERLARLAETPTPEYLAEGAMCYEAAEVPDRIEYICPKCSEKTLYSSWEPLVQEIPEFRREARPLHGVVELDESEFCRKCSPAAETPRIRIRILFPDGSVLERDRIQPEDLRMIKELLSGSALHSSLNDAESPLKDHIERLKMLFDL